MTPDTLEIVCAGAPVTIRRVGDVNLMPTPGDWAATKRPVSSNDILVDIVSVDDEILWEAAETLESFP